ncbi:MAG: methyltransferase domain-containing protein [Candidatus Auribacter fodinae]|uniref:Methyltransferase domain-containing protein n=1 Tax=Candidatus Auribacter fodinae TaxID=2093366 RepID=A0A3A4R0N7_9BACT|nr:MAG: methyltransferase domain-containing protein [Candidatus Auribacter fodinae]
MNQYYNLMACPLCRGKLTLKTFETEADKVKEGILICEPCNKKFMIVDFIPRMVPVNLYRNNEFQKKHAIQDNELLLSFDQTESLETLQENTDFYFGQEWEYYARLGWEGNTEFTYDESVKNFWSKTLLEKDDVCGKLILDGGCGNGRYSRIAMENGAKGVVSVDIGRNVDVAKSNLHNVGLDVFVVQADLLHLPFSPNVFDLVFTIGVLQHTGAPQEAFQSLVSVLKKSGLIAIRAYQRGNPTLEENDRKIREVTTKFSIEELHEFSKILFDLYNFAEKKNLVYQLKHYINIFSIQHSIFDWYAAPIADKFTYPQIREWFSQAGIKDIRNLEHRNAPEEKRIFSAISIVGEKMV